MKLVLNEAEFSALATLVETTKAKWLWRDALGRGGNPSPAFQNNVRMMWFHMVEAWKQAGGESA